MTNTRILPEAQTESPPRSTFRYAPLYWLALGAFAVGTEGFMIAAILPRIAGDLVIPLRAAIAAWQKNVIQRGRL